MELQRFGFKVFLRDGTDFDATRLIPVFHRWIQEKTVDDLMIDVADYSHVPTGPGVMLIAHEGNYGLDLGGGQPGLLYTRKQPTVGELNDRLTTVARTTLRACSLLEEAPELQGSLRFRGEVLAFVANDRLRLPNSAESRASISPALESLAALLYGKGKYALSAVGDDPRERLSLTLKTKEPVSVQALLKRLR